jgi:3-oxo-5-alpha-steroid 4-dehydrogenase 1
MQGRSLAHFSPASQSAAGLLAPHFVLGLSLFALGMAINWQADDILRNLRKPGETGYSIPRGGFFEMVSGANFFGEICEWAGFAVAAWSLPAAAFAAFTFCNIAPRGAQHHAW